MHKRTFDPFVGETYFKQDFKILVLGESHYLGVEDFNAFKKDQKGFLNVTKQVVARYLNYKKTGADFEKWMNTYSKFSNVFQGISLDRNQAIDFWQSIAFYNYVQFPLQKTRQAPNSEDFQTSIEAFKSVLKELNPNLIVFWGDRLWKYFPKENYFQGDNEDLHFLTYNSNFPIIVIPHPASSKLSSIYSEIITKRIAAVKLFNNS